MQYLLKSNFRSKAGKSAWNSRIRGTVDEIFDQYILIVTNMK